MTHRFDHQTFGNLLGNLVAASAALGAAEANKARTVADQLKAEVNARMAEISAFVAAEAQEEILHDDG